MRDETDEWTTGNVAGGPRLAPFRQVLAVDESGGRCLPEAAVYCSFVISECWASRPPSRSQRGRLKRDEVSCRLCCAVTGRKKCALACPANARSDDGQSQSQPHERRDLD